MKRRTLLSSLALGMIPIVSGMHSAISWATNASASTAVNHSKYPHTTEAMQERYADEMRAYHNYAVFSQKAVEEGYPNIAYLFTSLAESEFIHAHNFRARLLELGTKPRPVSGLDAKASSTKSNLNAAVSVEANEIDHKYPDIVKLISPENHQQSIDATTWAWQSEAQHRKLIIKMQKHVVRWWGIVSSKIEERHVTYYVCEICGSTLVEIPKETCPICGRPASEYRQIPTPKGYLDKSEK
jgi:rubrerythrin